MAPAKRRVMIFLVFALVAAAGLGAIRFIRAIIDVPAQAYAVWGTADLVIAYMEANEGAWPKCWEDLRPLAESTSDMKTSVERNGAEIVEFRPWGSIEELQRRVVVDWQTTPEGLLASPPVERGPPFRVIYLRNGKTTHYEGKEPNQMILDYLEWKQRQKGKPVIPAP